MIRQKAVTFIFLAGLGLGHLASPSPVIACAGGTVEYPEACLCSGGTKHAGIITAVEGEVITIMIDQLPPANAEFGFRVEVELTVAPEDVAGFLVDDRWVIAGGADPYFWASIDEDGDVNCGEVTATTSRALDLSSSDDCVDRTRVIGDIPDGCGDTAEVLSCHMSAPPTSTRAASNWAWIMVLGSLASLAHARRKS